MNLGELVNKVEAALKDTGFEWLVRQHGDSYFANIYDKADRPKTFPNYATTPTLALFHSFTSWQSEREGRSNG